MSIFRYYCWKKIGDDPIHQVAELTNEASFVIEVPKEYHNTDKI